MELKIEANIKLEDGIHDGVIIALEERQKPYEYIDVVIEYKVGETIARMKSSYPKFLATESKLGDLLARFGTDVSTPGTIINIDKSLIGKKCKFMTVTRPGKNGKEYANILPESVKPCK